MIVFVFLRLRIHEALPGQLHGKGYHGLGEEYKDGHDPGKDARTQGGHRHNVSGFSTSRRSSCCVMQQPPKLMQLNEPEPLQIVCVHWST